MVCRVIQPITNYLDVGWDLVKDVHTSKLQSLYRRMPLQKVRYLGIDEFSIRKGQEYMTVFLDLERGRILYEVEGRSKEAVEPFLQQEFLPFAKTVSGQHFWGRGNVSTTVGQVTDEIIANYPVVV